MPDMAEPPEFLKGLRSRIRERLEAEGLNAREASLQARLGPSAVSDILLGRNKSPGLSALLSIASVLKTDLEFLIGKGDLSSLAVVPTDAMRRIPVVGYIEAGVFRRVIESEPGGNRPSVAFIDAPRSKAFPMIMPLAYEVRGEDMNQAVDHPILPGGFVTCLPFKEVNKPVIEGQIYVFRQSFDGGNTAEIRLGRARVFHDRTELAPESSNRSIDAAVYTTDGDGDPTVAITDVVYGVYYRVGLFS